MLIPAIFEKRVIFIKQKGIRWLTFAGMLYCLGFGTQCGQHTEATSTPPSAIIGYEFYSSFKKDSTAPGNAVSIGMTALFERLDTNSKVFAAFEKWPSNAAQIGICKSLEAYPNVKLRLILEPKEYLRVAIDQLDKMPLALHRQVVIENKENATAGLLKGKDKNAKMRSNFVLAANLKSAGADDGKFTILSSDAPFSVEGGQPITEAIRMYGDSSLFARYLGFWEALRDNRTEFGFVTSHTYSNLHDHQAWFFPDQLAERPENAVRILEELNVGLQKTHQPAKVRLSITGADVCHASFFERLVQLAIDHEMDLKLVIADTAAISKRAISVLDGLPDGSLRIYSNGDSAHPQAFASRMILIDGPYPLIESEPASRRRLTFLFGDDLNLATQRINSSIWLRIADKRVFQDAETHWNRVWELSNDRGISERMRFNPQKRCLVQ